MGTTELSEGCSNHNIFVGSCFSLVLGDLSQQPSKEGIFGKVQIAGTSHSDWNSNFKPRKKFFQTELVLEYCSIDSDQYTRQPGAVLETLFSLVLFPFILCSGHCPHCLCTSYLHMMLNFEPLSSHMDIICPYVS